jgi:hypothetical protein
MPNSINNTCLEASIYRLRRPKSPLIWISLGDVPTEVKSVRTMDCATAFP